METVEIVDEELKQTKKGNDYVRVKLSDGRYLNLFAENFDAYDGFGKYEIDIERDGKFWNAKPKSVQKTPRSPITLPDSISQDAVAARVKPTIRERLASNVAQIDTNRAILVQVCIKAAAEAYGGRPGIPEHDKIIELAGRFLKFAEQSLKTPEMEDAPF